MPIYDVWAKGTGSYYGKWEGDSPSEAIKKMYDYAGSLELFNEHAVATFWEVREVSTKDNDSYPFGY